MKPEQESLRAVLGPVALALRAHGFRKRGRLWTRRPEPAFWHLIHAQTDSRGLNEIELTFNVGICVEELRRLAPVWREDDDTRAPGVYDAHVDWRLGMLLTDREPNDYWWAVDVNTDAKLLGSRISVYLEELAIPTLVENTNLDRICQELERRRNPGNFMFEAWLTQLGCGTYVSATDHPAGTPEDKEAHDRMIAEVTNEVTAAMLDGSFIPVGRTTIYTPRMTLE